MKQTAVEWLVKKLPLIQQEGLRDEIEQAKEIEKEQIMQAYNDGKGAVTVNYKNNMSLEEYYNETFKNETK